MPGIFASKQQKERVRSWRHRYSVISRVFRTFAFQRLAVSQAAPVLAWNRMIEEGLFGHQCGGIGQPHRCAFRRDLLDLLPRGGAIFLSLNDFQLRRHFFHLARRYGDPRVAIKMRRAPLPHGFGI